MTGPNGLNDSFAYNGLGQRVAKTDSTGQFALVSDGASPAAPVLADGLTVFTPGLSSRRNGASAFRHGDLLGSLRFETDANQSVTANRLYSAFGSTVASAGDPLTPFGWVGDGASQTDADTGLVLMGHRVYDSRLGRFLSQDPAGDGDNWYAYADNDPIDEADPSGLISQSVNGGNGWMTGSQLQDQESMLDPGTYNIYSKQSDQSGDGTFLKTITISAALNAAFTSTSGPIMFAGATPNKAANSTWYRATTSTLEHGEHVHRDSKSGPRYNREGQPIDGGEKPTKGPKAIPKRNIKDFQKVFDRLNPPRPGGAAAAGEEAAVEGGALEGLELGGGPVGMAIGAGIAIWDLYQHPEAGITTLTWRSDRP